MSEDTASGQVLFNSGEKIAQAQQTQTKPSLAGSACLGEPLASAINELAHSSTCSEKTKSVLQSVIYYVEKTGPTANLAAAQGAQMQIDLHRALKNYVNTADDDFRAGFSAILKIIYSQSKNGVFSPRMIFRFGQEMKVSLNDRLALEMLLQALVDLSRPDTRSLVLRQIDLGKISSANFSQQGTQRFLAFFML